MILMCMFYFRFSKLWGGLILMMLLFNDIDVMMVCINGIKILLELCLIVSNLLVVVCIILVMILIFFFVVVWIISFISW